MQYHQQGGFGGQQPPQAPGSARGAGSGGIGAAVAAAQQQRSNADRADNKGLSVRRIAFDRKDC